MSQCDDLISRQAAIDEIDEWIKEFKQFAHNESASDLKLVRKSIEELPSAQPEFAKDINVRSKDCISRQAAIDMFQNLAYDDWNQGAATTWAGAFSEAAEMICNLPSAQHEITEDDVKEYCRKRCLTVITDDLFHEMQRRWSSAQPERKKGRWINMDDHVMCSCCGATHHGADKNHCPNCGARMERSEDD